MKKLLIFGSLLASSFITYAQTWNTNGNSIGTVDFFGTTNIDDIRFTTNNSQKMVLTTGGKLGIGTPNPLFIFDVLSNSGGQGARITQGGNGPAVLHLNNTFVSGPINGNDWSLNSSGGGDPWGVGHFAIINSANGNPAFFINGNNGNTGLGGNFNPKATVHIGDGDANLHFGTTGVLIKFSSGDRTLMELHSPDGTNKLIMQSRSNAAYLSSIDNKPLLLQTSTTGGGNVAIGTDAALRKLNVFGNMIVGTNFDLNGIGPGNFEIMTDATQPIRRGISINPTGGAMDFYTYAGPNDAAFNFKERFSGNKLMSISVNGQVKIGQLSSQVHSSAKLMVDGEGVFKSGLYITNISDWADYVFAEDYKLPSLKEVEMFYKTKKHLPEIPTTSEVEQNGISIGEMNKLLLQKIEELTIYIVEQDKKLEQVKKEVEDIKVKLK